MSNAVVPNYGLTIVFISLTLFSCRSKTILENNIITYPINQNIEEILVDNNYFQSLYNEGKRIFYFRNNAEGVLRYRTLGIDLYDDVKIYADSNVYFIPVIKLNGKDVFVKGIFGVKGKNIEINGINIDGQNKANLGIHISSLGENCTISNCEIKNLTTESHNSAFGIQVENGAKNIIITDNYIHDIRDIDKPSQPIRAIQVGKVENIIIQNNVIDNLTSQEPSADVDAIHIQAGSDAWFSGASGVIKNNLFFNTRKRAIKLHTNDFVVSGNTIRSANETEYCVYSAITVFGANCKVINNDIELKRSLIGISLSGSNGKSSYNTIANNSIFIDTLFKFYSLRNWGSNADTVQIGIDIIAGAHNNTIKGNIINCPTIGIKLGESHQNFVSNNIILKSRFPLWVQNSTDIKLDANIYIDSQNKVFNHFKHTIFNSKSIETGKKVIDQRRIIDVKKRKSDIVDNNIIKEKKLLPSDYNKSKKTKESEKRKVKVFFPNGNLIFKSMGSFKDYLIKKHIVYTESIVYYILN